MESQATDLPGGTEKARTARKAALETAPIPSTALPSSSSAKTLPARAKPKTLAACVHPKLELLRSSTPAPASRCATDRLLEASERVRFPHPTVSRVSAPARRGAEPLQDVAWQGRAKHRPAAHARQHLQQLLPPKPEDTESPAQSCSAHPLALCRGTAGTFTIQDPAEAAAEASGQGWMPRPPAPSPLREKSSVSSSPAAIHGVPRL